MSQSYKNYTQLYIALAQEEKNRVSQQKGKTSWKLYYLTKRKNTSCASWLLVKWQLRHSVDHINILVFVKFGLWKLSCRLVRLFLLFNPISSGLPLEYHPIGNYLTQITTYSKKIIKISLMHLFKSFLILWREHAYHIQVSMLDIVNSFISQAFNKVNTSITLFPPLVPIPRPKTEPTFT